MLIISICSFSSLVRVDVSEISEESVTSSVSPTELDAFICSISSSEKKRVTRMPPALDSSAELQKRFLAVLEGPNSSIRTTPISPIKIRRTRVETHMPIRANIFPIIRFFEGVEDSSSLSTISS